MNITDLNGKKICILGFGREGKATLRAIEEYAPDAIVTIADANPKLQTLNPNLEFGVCHLEFQTGEDYISNLQRFDIIIKSPGIPPQPEFVSIENKITNATQIFLDTVQEAGSLVIGITGTKGKSTTSSLLYEILKAAGKDVHLVGNIGIPALDYLDKALCHTEHVTLSTVEGRSENTIFVQEMSSFQLMNLTSNPQIAVITSFFPEHLDYHQTIENYMSAKKHITRFQKEDDVVFYDASSKGATEIAEEGIGKKIPYTEAASPISIEETQLIGEHNLCNIAAATVVALHLNISNEDITSVIKAYKGLPHRLQKLGTHHEIEWINDSISTTPETTIAALDAIAGVDCIILGGKDRGLDYSALGQRITNSDLKHIILLGESSQRIQDSITSASIEFHKAKSMKEAVSIAKKNTDHICLLSPASASHDMFTDFEERGNLFVQYIAQE